MGILHLMLKKCLIIRLEHAAIAVHTPQLHLIKKILKKVTNSHCDMQL